MGVGVSLQLSEGNGVLSGHVGVWWGVNAALQSVMGEDIRVSSWNVIAGGHRSVCQRGEGPEGMLAGSGVCRFIPLEGCVAWGPDYAEFGWAL